MGFLAFLFRWQGVGWVDGKQVRVLNGVVDPWHFGTDPNPIRIRGYVQLTHRSRIRILVWILPLSSVAFKIPNEYFFFLLLFDGTFTSFLKDKKRPAMYPALRLGVVEAALIIGGSRYILPWRGDVQVGDERTWTNWYRICENFCRACPARHQ